MTLKANVKICFKELNNISNYTKSISKSTKKIEKLLIYKKDKEQLERILVSIAHIEEHVNLLDNRISDNPDIVKGFSI